MVIGRKIAVILGAFLLSGANMAPAVAAEDGRQFSAASGELVNEALTLANTGQILAAMNVLSGAIEASELTAYERSMIYQMIGQYSYDLDRPVEAQTAFEQAIGAGGLLPKEAEDIKIVIAQLMIGNGQFREGAGRLEAYLNSGGQPKPEYIDLLVNAWIQAEDYQRARPWAEKWFDAARPKQREHFDLLIFLYNSLGLQGHQADIVQKMIARWPEDKELMDIWASLLANGGREDEAFEVKKIMYLKGMLTTEPELLKVVQYYSFYDMPYQAAQILETEMGAARISRTPETLKQLSDLFRQAREYRRAIPILEAAAGQSGDIISQARLYAELGEALYNEGDCKKSELAFFEAMKRGYDAGKSWMLIASCRYDSTVNLDRLNCEMSDAEMESAPITRARNSAIEAFEQVPKQSGERGNAKTWLQFIGTEKQALKKRCEFEENVRKEACFKKIKQTYDTMVLSREFNLDDEVCEIYVAEYDAKYRMKEPSQ